VDDILRSNSARAGRSWALWFPLKVGTCSADNGGDRALPSSSLVDSTTNGRCRSYNRNLWMHHLNGDAAYLPV
jgi:hypothetical protein